MASKVLLLGSSGLVGNYLLTALRDHYRVHAPTRDQLDLLDTRAVLEFFNKTQFDAVINCAANTNSAMNRYDPLAAATNLGIFANLYAARSQYGRLINFGSGAEFDRSNNINQAREEDLFLRQPLDHYGQSKNFAARIAFVTENFYTLRLFGVFGPQEPAWRLLQKVVQQEEPMVLQDKYFDYYYIEDLLPVVLYYINNEPQFKDVNLVYPTKMLISDFVYQFCNVHQLPTTHITIDTTAGLHYTGNSKKLQELNLPLLGIQEGLKDYI